MRKSLVFGLCFLLICSIIIPVSLGNTVKKSSYVNESEIIEISDFEKDWWPTIYHDNQRTGFSTSHAYDYLTPEWTYKGTGAFYSPIISQNKLYIGSHNNNVYCLDIYSGEVIWSYKTGAAVTASPAEFNNRLYFGSNDQKVYCLNALNGEFIWSYKTGSGIQCSPVVYDGKVYIGSSDHKLYCLDAINGELIWDHEAWDRITSSPAIYNNNVYFGSYDRNMVCLNATNGDTVWGYHPGGGLIRDSPAIYNGNVYFGNVGHGIFCLNATNGAEIWTNYIGREVLSSPAIAYDKVYAVCYDDWRLFCLNASNGEEIWRYKAGGIIWVSPIVADGKVFFTSEEHLLYCLNCSTGEVLWTYDIGGIVYFGSPIIVDGTIYLGNHNSKIHALRTREFNKPPKLPTVSGPRSGKPNVTYEYVIISKDPDEDPIFYYVDWGDDTNTGWLGEYASGKEITLSHNWSWEDIFTFKIRVKDKYGFESECREIEIKISNPRIRTCWLRFFDMFPKLQRLLDYIK